MDCRDDHCQVNTVKDTADQVRLTCDVCGLVYTQEMFHIWRDKVNDWIVKLRGLDIDSYPDYDYWNAWKQGANPCSMAIWVIETTEGY